MKEPVWVSSSNLFDDLKKSSGGSRTPPHGKKGRSGRLMEEDDLMSIPLSNDAKATGIANELIYYLVNELRNNMFPKWVNPTHL